VLVVESEPCGHKALGSILSAGEGMWGDKNTIKWKGKLNIFLIVKLAKEMVYYFTLCSC
jgi:hypothetical protein